jgi:hypothetical protein
MIYQTRLILLTIKPFLYLLNPSDKIYLNSINKENIALNFRGIKFTFKKPTKMYIENNTPIKENCNFIKKIYYEHNYNINPKVNKLSKKDYLLRKHKENKNKFLQMKEIKRQSTIGKKKFF